MAVVVVLEESLSTTVVIKVLIRPMTGAVRIAVLMVRVAG
jgi:hypothetical protein